VSLFVLSLVSEPSERILRRLFRKCLPSAAGMVNRQGAPRHPSIRRLHRRRGHLTQAALRNDSRFVPRRLQRTCPHRSAGRKPLLSLPSRPLSAVFRQGPALILLFGTCGAPRTLRRFRGHPRLLGLGCTQAACTTSRAKPGVLRYSRSAALTSTRFARCFALRFRLGCSMRTMCSFQSNSWTGKRDKRLASRSSSRPPVTG